MVSNSIDNVTSFKNLNDLTLHKLRFLISKMNHEIDSLQIKMILF